MSRNSFTEENYLKAIYKIAEKIDNEGVSTNEIASAMSTKAASVTDMLKKLADKSLIDYKKYQGVRLTNKGEKIAVDIIRKHRLWELFLVDKLGFKWDEVHDMAEQLEHIQSDELVDRLDSYLDFPKYDPHGDPIPNKSGVFATKKMLELYDMPVGFRGNISGVSDHSPVFLKHLEKIGITLGVEIKVEDKNQFDNSFWISIADADPIFISKEVAKNLLVFKK
jgi:DtxR family Mn-dependent transcriptional regulator